MVAFSVPNEFSPFCSLFYGSFFFLPRVKMGLKSKPPRTFLHFSRKEKYVQKTKTGAVERYPLDVKIVFRNGFHHSMGLFQSLGSMYLYLVLLFPSVQNNVHKRPGKP